MSLTKTNLQMIDPGPNVDEGDRVQQTNDGLKALAPTESPDEALTNFLIDFDRQSGTITLNINGVTRRATGLPTEQNLPEGKQGLRGREGKQGQSGRNGRDGAPGIQGCIGPKGDRGPKGATGATGQRGLLGPQGPLGPTGPQGDKGDPGDDGQEPEYNPGARNVAGSNVTQPGDVDEEGFEVQGQNAHIRIQENGGMIAWGRVITAGDVTGAVSVNFARAFANRVTGYYFFFSDPNSYQAQNYGVPEFIPADEDIGGFTLGITGSPTLPLADPWDFFWIAMGD